MSKYPVLPFFFVLARRNCENWLKDLKQLIKSLKKNLINPVFKRYIQEAQLPLSIFFCLTLMEDRCFWIKTGLKDSTNRTNNCWYPEEFYLIRLPWAEICCSWLYQNTFASPECKQQLCANDDTCCWSRLSPRHSHYLPLLLCIVWRCDLQLDSWIDPQAPPNPHPLSLMYCVVDCTCASVFKWCSLFFLYLHIVEKQSWVLSWLLLSLIPPPPPHIVNHLHPR